MFPVRTGALENRITAHQRHSSATETVTEMAISEGILVCVRLCQVAMPRGCTVLLYSGGGGDSWDRISI